MMIKRGYSVLGAIGLAIGLLVLALLGWMWWQARAELSGEAVLPGLSAEAAVATDALGIPSITASGREDAMCVLGYLHASDRLFQMELMRRKTAGRLAELFGSDALELDRRQRIYGFESVARRVVARLPPAQDRLLTAYAAGVNAWLDQHMLLPPEMMLLRMTPEPWRKEDSLLVALGMFQTLNGQEHDERMLSVLERALPPELVAFLTPDTGPYTTTLLGGGASRRPPRPLPAASWAALVASESHSQTAGPSDRPPRAGVDAEALIAGSNNWVVAGSKTRDGRAIVANDMHLSLGVPNIWYRAALRYGGRELTGLTLPGLPMVVAGSNGRVAWGFTNIDADLLDLVTLERDPDDPERYRTPSGWRSLERRHEVVKVKGGADVDLEVNDTVWGPVTPTVLLGEPVAIHWTALQPEAIDLGLVAMDQAETLEQALTILNRSGAPPQNVVLADDKGHIAWTYMGRFPRRYGFDGSVSRSWADGRVGWDGYIPPAELPRLIDPPAGYIATANNRTLGRDYPYVIGHNYSNAYRAWRIGKRLEALREVTEADLLAVQLDARSEPLDFYRGLALEVLDDSALKNPLLREAHAAIVAWNGLMEADSVGGALLLSYRKNLAEAVFAPVVARGRGLDPQFQYAWREMETPLRALLSRRGGDVLADSGHGDRRELLLRVLQHTAEELQARYPDIPLSRLTWGRVNRLVIRHPLARGLPEPLGWLFNMDAIDSPGCGSFCVRVISDPHGATERMVVSPGHASDGILHMPGGQSGHPLSPHYRDQQDAWRDGQPLPFLPGPALAHLRLIPAPIRHSTELDARTSAGAAALQHFPQSIRGLRAILGSYGHGLVDGVQ